MEKDDKTVPSKRPEPTSSDANIAADPESSENISRLRKLHLLKQKNTDIEEPMER